MFPFHCNEVGVQKVEFSLCEDAIRRATLEKQVYAKTRYLVLTNGGEWAVVKLASKGNGLFREVCAVEVIALPEDVEYIEDSSVNVLSASAMAKVASASSKGTVIVKGAFDHISFIQVAAPIRLIVNDVTPPKPPKLLHLVEDVLKFEDIDRPLIVVPKILDLNSLARPEDSVVMLPCRTSGIELKQKALFLDEAPRLSKSEAESVTLLGCDLSREIFLSLYDASPSFRNMCPRKWTSEEGLEELSLSLCCRVDGDFRREGNRIFLPWGVTRRQVEAALKSFWE